MKEPQWHAESFFNYNKWLTQQEFDDVRVHVKTTEESARATAVLSQVLLPSLHMLPLSEFSCLVALTRAVIMSQNLLQRSLCMLCRTGRWHVRNACCVTLAHGLLDATVYLSTVVCMLWQ